MFIRKAKETDHDGVWEIFSSVIKTGDTYVFNPDTPRSSLQAYWFADVMDTFVAVENDEIIGTYFMKPNQLGLGNHIANCGYMVSPNHRGKGIGGLLCEHSLQFAKEKGYYGIQFNIVVSTNKTAVDLWQKLGFRIIGTTPKGFRHQDLGLVDSYIMFREV
ncbi:GNAT family N-acetyltransferase [Emticicia sp. C21]|uniref:GNAT family N-acetyltransferase n=1 Tax=Emticicia sp. C21 TaxID=2302915 RepID=UPI000E347209|nr:GNAT family N-acetyltransferase [Emticicia sp. C21]RFS15198.1 GNAT family N-acetyltransferase [Emticicia sp. C21]